MRVKGLQKVDLCQSFHPKYIERDKKRVESVLLDHLGIVEQVGCFHESLDLVHSNILPFVQIR